MSGMCTPALGGSLSPGYGSLGEAGVGGLVTHEEASSGRRKEIELVRHKSPGFSSVNSNGMLLLAKAENKQP